MTVEITSTEAVYTCGKCHNEARVKLVPPGSPATAPSGWSDVTLIQNGQPAASRTLCAACTVPVRNALAPFRIQGGDE